jgi:ATP-dependent protease ClpP protease subunit
MMTRTTSPIDIAIPAPASRRRDRLFARVGGAESLALHSDDNGTVIEIFDEIGGFGVSPSDVKAQLADAGRSNVTVRLNSPGGSVFDGITIFNTLVAHPGRVRVEIVGLAASAASLIAMAGDEIAIAENAFVMVHRAWGMTIGNEADHTEQAGVLRKVDIALAETYARRTGNPVAAVSKMMEAETWLKGDEAKRLGFATEMLGAVNIGARFDLSIYAKVPSVLAETPTNTAHLSSRAELETLLKERLNLSRAAAKKIAAGGFNALSKPDEDQQLVSDLIARLAKASANLKGI